MKVKRSGASETKVLVNRLHRYAPPAAFMWAGRKVVKSDRLAPMV
jgi:hypothetical protein